MQDGWEAFSIFQNTHYLALYQVPGTYINNVDIVLYEISDQTTGHIQGNEAQTVVMTCHCNRQ